MRVFAISDVHVDYDENARWVKQLSDADYRADALILAGDLTDSPALMAMCFEQFSRKFAHVFFVPGNHDIWVSESERMTSLEKFEHVLSMADAFGIETQARTIGAYTFVPIFSWYDFSFGQPSEYIRDVWMDFRRCLWPQELDNHSLIFDYFIGKSPHHSEVSPGGTVISFSHFLPRIDVMPSFIPQSKREIYPVLGSRKIDEHVRRLNSHIHVYGHSHVNRCIHIDGVCYVNNAFGYPKEGNISRKRLFNILDEI